MKSAGKARSNGLYRHIRTSKEIIRNLLNDYLYIYILLSHITSVHILYTQAECALPTLLKTAHANHEIPTIEDIPLMSIDVQSEFLQFSKFLTKCG